MAYSDEVLADNPVIYYKLDETSGNIAYSDGSWSANGTYVGTPTKAQPPGPIGSTYSVGLNGTSQFVKWTTDAARSNAPVSLEIWVKFDSFANYTGLLGAWHGNSSGNYGISLDVNTTGNIDVNIPTTNFNGWVVNQGGFGSLSTNTWYHIVLTIDSVNLVAKLYLDGEQIGVISIPASPGIWNASKDLQFGKDYTNYVDGNIDEVAVYNYVLSPSRIQAHYNAGIGNEDFGTTIDVDNAPEIGFVAHNAAEFPGEPQILVPNGDIASAGWVLTGSQPTAWQSVLQNTITSYVRRGMSGTTTQFPLKISLSDPELNPGPGTWKARYVIYNAAPNAQSIRLELHDSSGLLQEWHHGATNYTTPTLIERTFTYTGNDWNNLEFWALASADPHFGDEVRLYFVEVEAPSFAGAVETIQDVDNTPNIVLEGYDAWVGQLIEVVVENVATIEFNAHEPFIFPRVPILYARPVGDISNDGWLKQPSNAPNIWSLLDDGDDVWPADDQYIYFEWDSSASGAGPGTKTAIIKLDAVPKPILNSSIEIKFHANMFRSHKSAGVPYVILRNGDDNSLISAMWMPPGITGTATTFTQTYTKDIVERVHDWSDLIIELRYEAFYDVLGQLARAGVNWIRLDVPNGEGSVEIEPSLGTAYLAAYEPTLTTERNIPDPAEILIQGWDAEITPGMSLATSAIFSTSHWGIRVLDLDTKQIDEGWPSSSFPGEVFDAVANNEHLILGSSSAYRGRLEVYSISTKERITGFPSLNREINSIALHPDGTKFFLGTAKHTASDHFPVSPGVNAFHAINLTTKTYESGWPTINSAILDIAVKLDGSKIALACAEAPYLRVIDTATKQLETYPDVENNAFCVGWVLDKLFVTHRGGKRLTVYNGSKEKEEGWPTLGYSSTNAMAVSPKTNAIAVTHNNRLATISLASKELSEGFPELPHQINALSWVAANVVAVGLFSPSPANPDPGVLFFDIYSKTTLTDYPNITTSNIHSIQTGGELVDFHQNATIEASLANFSFASPDPVIETLQLITPSAGEIVLSAPDPVVSSPSVTVFVESTNFVFAGHEAHITPVDYTVLPNLTQVVIHAYEPTISALSLRFKLVAADDPAFTGRDATEITSFDLGAAMYGTTRMIGFRIANVQDIRHNFLVGATSANTILSNGVYFSYDKENWEQNLLVSIAPNAVSEVIYLKLEVPNNAPVGESTFLIQANEVVGSI